VPGYSDLPELDYVRMVIEESIRITPPGWVFSRSTTDWDRLGEYAIPPRSMIFISPYLMHHHPEIWPEPESFKPDRFARENEEKIQALARDFAYIPFSGGPRVCTGRNLAMVESLLIVARAVQRFKFELKPGHVVRPRGGFTLGLEGGLWVKLARRGA
jgi:cytochrome P450